jgi:hypothetical protein
VPSPLEALQAATVVVTELADRGGAVLQVRGDPEGGVGGGPEPCQLRLLAQGLVEQAVDRLPDQVGLGPPGR